MRLKIIEKITMPLGDALIICSNSNKLFFCIQISTHKVNSAPDKVIGSMDTAIVQRRSDGKYFMADFNSWENGLVGLHEVIKTDKGYVEPWDIKL